MVTDEDVSAGPNFFVIGTYRAGTTSFYHYVGQHPEVFMSGVKEPNFFAFEGRRELVDPQGTRELPGYSTEWDRYRRLFSNADDYGVRGEASPLYLFSPEAPRRIARRTTGTRMVVLLRNPVDRAFSGFLKNRMHGGETAETFDRALELEEKRVQNDRYDPGYFYKRLGLYGTQLQRYFENFSRKRIKIVLFRRFVAEPLTVMKEVHQFLGVDPEFRPAVDTSHNPSGRVRSQFLRNIFVKRNFLKAAVRTLLPGALRRKAREWILHGWNVDYGSKPSMGEGNRRRLLNYYRKDIRRLDQMIEHDVSSWLDE